MTTCVGPRRLVRRPRRRRRRRTHHRRPRRPGAKDTIKGRRGVRIYKATDGVGASGRGTFVEAGGVAVEDLAAVDLDGDGKIDIVAAGRQTHNLRIYWNQGAKK